MIEARSYDDKRPRLVRSEPKTPELATRGAAAAQQAGTSGLDPRLSKKRRWGREGVRGTADLGSGLGEIVIGTGSGANDLTIGVGSGLAGFGDFSGNDILGELLHEVGDTLRGTGSGAQDLTNGVGEGIKNGDVYLQTGLGSALDELLSQVGSAVDQVTVLLYQLLHQHLLQLAQANAGANVAANAGGSIAA
ncbi:hypothetical protein AAVH_16676 [Aphelenchoides avenae]|nr:hypothetical protein AAVH_16676 [Aphelenchus avenae]